MEILRSSEVFSRSLSSPIWYNLILLRRKISSFFLHPAKQRHPGTGSFMSSPWTKFKSESLFETNKPNFHSSLVPSKDTQDDMEFLLQVSHITKDIKNTSSSKSRNTAPCFDFAVLTNFNKLGKKRQQEKGILQPKRPLPPPSDLGNGTRLTIAFCGPEKKMTQCQGLLSLTASSTHSVYHTFGLEILFNSALHYTVFLFATGFT